MNVGVVSYRYAKALLKFVQETGTGKEVYSQVMVLVRRMSQVEQFRYVLESREDVPLERKLELMSAAAEAPLLPEIVRFINLVSSKGRIDMLSRMLNSFLEQYREANNMKTGSLVTAVPADGLKERLEEMFSSRTGSAVTLSEEVDPEIIGGFVLKLGDCMLDASVEGRLRRIRDGLVDNNNRIV